MRRAYHIARADFLQRVRSRSFLVVLAVIAYFGYLVNVGQIELAYQVELAGKSASIHGTNTSEFVGLKAGLAGAAVLLIGGFYMMNTTLERDRINNIDRLVASTTVSDLTYLFGKWLSNVALSVAVVITLAVATVINHLVHGVGPTEPLTLVGPLFVFALPLGVLVGAVALFFETVDWLNATGGNLGYLVLIGAVLASLSAEGKLPEAVSLSMKAIDLMGKFAVYELTVDALHTKVPAYSNGPPSFGTLNADQTFSYTGHGWPLWIFVQRVWLLVPTAVILLGAVVPFDRLGSTDSSERPGLISRAISRLPKIRGTAEPTETDSEPQPLDSLSLTPVTDRDAGSFWRLVVAEMRLAVRGRQWWWYAGVALFVFFPISGLLPLGIPTLPIRIARKLLLPLTFVWPMFVWSDMGVRTVRNRVTDLIFSSRYSVAQLFAEWLSGIVVGLGVCSGLIALFVSAGEMGALLGVVSGVVFVPSFAIAMGMWSRSSWLFEITYLLLWYAGPLNGGEPIDFVGSTPESVQMGAPLVFLGLSVVCLGVALLRRKLELGEVATGWN